MLKFSRIICKSSATPSRLFSRLSKKSKVKSILTKSNGVKYSFIDFFPPEYLSCICVYNRKLWSREGQDQHRCNWSQADFCWETRRRCYCLAGFRSQEEDHDLSPVQVLNFWSFLLANCRVLLGRFWYEILRLRCEWNLNYCLFTTTATIYASDWLRLVDQSPAVPV